VNVLECVQFLCQVTGNLHIRRGLQVACYGLEKALRRPQDERDESIRTPRFFCCILSRRELRGRLFKTLILNSMKKETLKTLIFWIGVVLMTIPTLYMIIDSCFWIVEPSYYQYQKEGLHFGYCFGDFVDFVSGRYDNPAIPLIILFLVGSAAVSFSLAYQNKGFNKVILKKRSVFACVLGGLVWIFLIAIILFDEFWWCSWMLLALSGTALLVFGIRNLVEN